ncbi:unnamed protein product [Anisakis simplex]|uniref:Secreted protein n=1 Tax=Anisakis simplex TaxID=6269 RepID=A0A0M3K0N4_ANISI|nr:unnamed protein product [Anisakis simplex]
MHCLSRHSTVIFFLLFLVVADEEVLRDEDSDVLLIVVDDFEVDDEGGEAEHVYLLASRDAAMAPFFSRDSTNTKLNQISFGWIQSTRRIL